jgi:hypothetical protein
MASTSTTKVQSVSDLALNILEEIRVNAPIAVTFETLLEQIGPENIGAGGKPMPLKIELWPGGRWYRDLGDGNGHFWANVQAIKKPTLLEFSGPLFMSAPVMSNVQYRLSEVDGGTLIKFQHLAFGFVPDDYRTGVTSGWKGIHERVRKAAEERKRPH